MTIQEAFQRLGKSESTIRRWIKQGKLTTTLVKGVNQIPDDQVNDIADGSVNDRAATGQMTAQDKLIDQLQSEVEYLRSELKETKERSDTIILNLTRQLENQQLMLEDKSQPWYRRVFRKRKQDDQ